MKAERWQRWVTAEGKTQGVEEDNMKPTEWLAGKAATE